MLAKDKNNETKIVEHWILRLTQYGVDAATWLDQADDRILLVAISAQALRK